jgi:hypothetical protein
VKGGIAPGPFYRDHLNIRKVGLPEWEGATLKHSKMDHALARTLCLSASLLEHKQVEKICVHNIPEGGV